MHDDHHHDHFTEEHDHAPYIEDNFFATVLGVERLTPSMIRVVLHVEGGERLIPSGHYDEWVRLAFRPHPDAPVTLPILMENGKWGRPDGSQPCPNRPYTIRDWDPATCRMVVDIVVHEGGVAATWAMNTFVGDVIALCNPEGRFWFPKGSKWLLMIVDITGLPAVGRVLENLPAGFTAIVHVEIPTDADRQELQSPANVEVHWHACHGLRPERAGYTELPRIAQTITALPDGPGYIYVAGEARAASDCRKHFRDVLGFDKDRIDAIGYWIEGQART